MIVFSIGKTEVRIDFSFFAVLCICFFLDKSGVCLFSILAAAAHEFGHFAAILLCGESPDSVTLYGAGIRINCLYQRLAFWGQICVLAAGCCTNLLLFAAAMLCGAEQFAAVNLVTCAFNLLCIGRLDGALIVRAICAHMGFGGWFSGIAAALSFSAAAAAAIIMGNGMGITFYLTIAYMLLLSLRELKN